MKKAISVMLVLFLATFISATAQNKVDKQGRRQGHWVRTDTDGKKIFEGDFVDGKETGEFKYYYRNGNLRIRNVYFVPGKQCSHEAYDEEGHLLAKGFYFNRNRDSVWTYFDEQGRKIKEAAYRMGVRHGLHVVFNSNGDTAEVATWKNNHRNGRWWKRIGEKGYITATYIDGGIEGRLVEYNDDQELVREGNYNDGLKHGSYRYFEKKRLTIDETWEHGFLIERKILVLLPQEDYISIYDIACMAPKGKMKTIIVMKDGKEITTLEGADDVYERVGNELFASANRKSRILVSRKSVQGIGTDKEGRDILLLDPQPSFAIYPDEDGVKMVRSVGYENNSPLDKFSE